MMGYSKMALKITRKWESSRSDGTISMSDLYNEAIMGLMKAISYYTHEDYKFSTVAYWIIHRRLRERCNKTTPLSEIPNCTVNLRQKFEAAKKEINRSATFEEIVETMWVKGKDGEPRPLTKGEIHILKRALVTVYSQTSLRGLHANEAHDDRISDYSSLGSMEFSGMTGRRDWRVVGMRGKSNLNPVFAPQDDLGIDLDEIMEGVDFSEFEQSVLDSFLADGTNGWMTRAASELTNPDTEKPYSKMAVSYAWDRILKKLRKQAGEED
jgi:RNA polymerase sigma factor (sigma-70 family)